MGTRANTSMRVVLGAVLAAAMPALAAAQGNPKVAPRDQLVITIVNIPDWSRAYPVGADGMLDFPQLGRVKVEGLTAREVEAALVQKLKDGNIHFNPQVTVEVQQTPNKKVSIFGPVRVPGPLPFAGEMTLLDAIGRAGGRQPEAADEVLVIHPMADGSPGEPIRVNIRKIEGGDLTNNLTLQDGDQILVLKAQAVFVSGEVRSPGAFNVEAGTTVQQAITLAGGITERGAKNRIQIKRVVKGKTETLKVTENEVVRPGDTIIVGRRIL